MSEEQQLEEHLAKLMAEHARLKGLREEHQHNPQAKAQVEAQIAGLAKEAFTKLAKLQDLQQFKARQLARATATAANQPAGQPEAAQPPSQPSSAGSQKKELTYSSSDEELAVLAGEGGGAAAAEEEPHTPAADGIADQIGELQGD